MADNYLEKQYEQYRERKAEWERRQKSGAGHAHGQTSKKSLQASPAHAADRSNGKRVFITGGADGIGRGLVQSFCQDGHRVAFCDTDCMKGEQTARECGAVFMQADVADAEALEACMNRLFEEWGDIDILINNAGIGGFVSITDSEVADFDRVLSVNLRPVFVTSRALARHRRKQAAPNTYGRIINIASTRYLMSEPGTEAYSASKGGIYSLTHALALSLSEFRITVNSVAPGWIMTKDYDTLRPEDHEQHPSRRVGKPGDIARVCLFLCHEENDFINGENLTVDGGMTKKMIYVE